MRSTILLLSVAILPVMVHAQPGMLDPSFSTDGLTTTDIGASTFDKGSAVAVENDGRIVVVGTAGYDKMYDFAAVRYLANGTPDPAFSANGEVFYSMVPGNDLATAVVIQDDGKILVGGYGQCVEGNCFGMMRMLTDGTLDPAFGNGGIVTTEYTGALTTEAKAIAVQDDGKILLAGGGTAGFAVVRYHPDGVVDDTFGNAGLATCAFGTGNDRANAMALLSDGRIVLSGYSTDAAGDSIAVGRLMNDGSIDPSFGTNGRVRASLPNVNTIGQAMAVGPDGSIAVAGYSVPPFGTEPSAMVARFTSDGQLDASFNGNGLRDLAVAGSDASILNGVIVQSDGKTVLCGAVTTPAIDFLLIRLNIDGSDDTGFNGTGTTTTDFSGTTDRANAIALQSDGRIVVAGETNGGPEDYNFAVARYLNDVELDIPATALDEAGMDVFPVPITGGATLSYSLSQTDVITIELLDARGAVIDVLMEQRAHAAGSHQWTFSLSHAIACGTYALRASGTHTLRTLKVIVE